jgi:hypothetical protein
LRVLRVLAARDQARWDLGLVDVGGGRGRPDARKGGGVARRHPGKRLFVSDVYFLCVAVLRRVHLWISKWMAR